VHERTRVDPNGARARPTRRAESRSPGSCSNPRAPIVGARTFQQFEENIAALELALSEARRAALDRASAIEPSFPHDMLNSRGFSR
jgi:hypothetical protein